MNATDTLTFVTVEPVEVASDQPLQYYVLAGRQGDRSRRTENFKRRSTAVRQATKVAAAIEATGESVFQPSER